MNNRAKMSTPRNSVVFHIHELTRHLNRSSYCLAFIEVECLSSSNKIFTILSTMYKESDKKKLAAGVIEKLQETLRSGYRQTFIPFQISPICYVILYSSSDNPDPGDFSSFRLTTKKGNMYYTPKDMIVHHVDEEASVTERWVRAGTFHRMCYDSSCKTFVRKESAIHILPPDQLFYQSVVAAFHLWDDIEPLRLEFDIQLSNEIVDSYYFEKQKKIKSRKKNAATKLAAQAEHHESRHLKLKDKDDFENIKKTNNVIRRGHNQPLSKIMTKNLRQYGGLTGSVIPPPKHPSHHSTVSIRHHTKAVTTGTAFYKQKMSTTILDKFNQSMKNYPNLAIIKPDSPYFKEEFSKNYINPYLNPKPTKRQQKCEDELKKEELMNKLVKLNAENDMVHIENNRYHEFAFSKSVRGEISEKFSKKSFCFVKDIKFLNFTNNVGKCLPAIVIDWLKYQGIIPPLLTFIDFVNVDVRGLRFTEESPSFLT